MNLIFLYKKIQIKGVEFILKKTIIYDLFLIKPIFVVIVNKGPPSKKVHLLLLFSNPQKIIRSTKRTTDMVFPDLPTNKIHLCKCDIT